MEEFVDLDEYDLKLKVDYLNKKIQNLQSKSISKKIYENSQSVYHLAYSVYILSKLSIPFYLFCKLYFGIKI